MNYCITHSPTRDPQEAIAVPISVPGNVGPYGPFGHPQNLMCYHHLIAILAYIRPDFTFSGQPHLYDPISDDWIPCEVPEWLDSVWNQRFVSGYWLKKVPQDCPAGGQALWWVLCHHPAARPQCSKWNCNSLVSRTGRWRRWGVDGGDVCINWWIDVSWWYYGKSHLYGICTCLIHFASIVNMVNPINFKPCPVYDQKWVT